MKELKKQHLEMLQLLESIEVMLQNGNSIHPNSVIRGAIQTAIGMEVDVTNVNDKCDNKQTAVEWLIDEAMKLVVQYMQGTLNEDTLDEVIYELGTKAKAMEKQRLEQFYNQGYTQCSIEDLKPTSRDRYEDAEDYYNKIFKLE